MHSTTVAIDLKQAFDQLARERDAAEARLAAAKQTIQTLQAKVAALDHLLVHQSVGILMSSRGGAA